jgi:hypothetical protein
MIVLEACLFKRYASINDRRKEKSFLAGKLKVGLFISIRLPNQWVLS